MPTRDRIELRRRLANLASVQSGYFTAAQALSIGYSYPAQKYHADRGTWLKVDRGLYRLSEWPVGRHDDLVRWYLWSRERAVISHETALAVYELGDVSPARVHLTVPQKFRAKGPGIVLHRDGLTGADVRNQEGFKITTPLRSLLDVAAGSLDQDLLSGAVRDGLDQGLVTRRALLSRAPEFGPHATLRIERALQGEAA